MWYLNLEKKNIYFSTYPTQISIYLSHCFTSVSKPAAEKSFDYCLSHFCIWTHIICDFWTLLREFLNPGANRFTQQTLPTIKRKYFFVISFALSPFDHKKKRTTECCYPVVTPQARSPFGLLKLASEHAYARLLLRLSWSWIVLLPSDTHRKPITSITAVLLPFVTYLLTLSLILTRL
jgi:hypothetical protein